MSLAVLVVVILRKMQFIQILSTFSRMPYDWRTPIGYACTMAIQTCISFGTSFIVARIITLYIVFCKFFDVFGRDVIESFRYWDNEMITGLLDRIEQRQKFIGIIQLHVNVLMYGLFLTPSVFA